MSPRQSDSRQRLVAAAAEMLAQHGLNATSIRETAKRADAPLGSTYHHFPGGKQQVVVEAVQLAGDRMAAGLDQQFQPGFAAGLRGFVAAWRERLIRSEFRIGCPVVAAVIEEPIDDADNHVVAAAAEVFVAWERRIVRALVAEGFEEAVATRLATLVVASIEGAIVLCRAARSIEPFDRVTTELEQLVAAHRR